MSFLAIISFLKNLLVSVMVFIGMIITPHYYADAKDAVNNINEDTFRSSQTTLAYDIEGNVITKFKEDKDSYYIKFEDIPKYVKDSFVATEDKEFYEHNGVDLVGVARAAVGLVKNGEISGGGSTITQQLSRNIFLTHEKSFERKFKEVYISVLVEKEHSKEEILEYYINSIYFSNGAYGIESASRKYFGKSVSELTLAEITFLSAIPNNPKLYNPLENFDNTVKRQKRILDYMLEEELITEEEKKNALAQEIVLYEEKMSKNAYVDSYITDSAIKILMEIDGFDFRDSFKDEKDRESYNVLYNEAKEAARKKLLTEGYIIHTSIDMKKQDALQRAIDTSLSSFVDVTDKGIYGMQGAATSIDNATGKVVAIVGGRSQDGINQSFNRAFQSYRQPGSIFKPLILYTPLFENGYYPSSIVIDEKEVDGPRNYADEYEGIISLRYAVEESKNTVAWSLLKELGVKNGFSYIEKMGLKKIVEDDYNLSAALGGLTYGTNTLEMAAAYSALARDGRYIEPNSIIKMYDRNGNLVYKDSEYFINVYSEKASRIMTDVLSTTMLNGTASELQLTNMVSAGKTGSTNDSKDGWFAGYTPYYTTVVWSGYDMPKAVDTLYGSTYPGVAWKQYMNEIHVGLENKPFEVYANLQAEEALIQEQEYQKVIAYELAQSIYEFNLLDLSTYDGLLYADAVYWDLINRAYGIVNEEKRTSYINQLNERKAYIDEVKTWYYY